jgi:(p)ppGpp synthase/HD superfamily hydrolase
MHNIEKAIQIAMEAHRGQVDKAGKPYILHPFRLMNNFDSENEKIAAILHDVVEDSHITIEDLEKEGIPTESLEIIECLTKRSNEKYEDFINRISLNKSATKVKIKDIEDNMNISRLNSIEQKDLDRLVKYHNALKNLKTVK